MGNKKKGKILAVLLSGALIGTQIPGMTVAEGAAGYTGGICGHHPVHTAECGYQEAVPEQPCRHEHTKECYEYETSCVHEHTEECYPLVAVEAPAEAQEGTDEPAQLQTELVRGTEPTACIHVCSEESGCVTKTLNCVHEDKKNADGSITYAVHDASCGYAPAVEGKECTFVCEICSAQSLSETETEALTVQTGIAEAEGADSEPSAKTTEAGDEGADEDETDSETETSTEKTTEAGVEGINENMAGTNITAMVKGAVEKTPDSDAETETDEAVPDEAVTALQKRINELPDVETVKQMTSEEQNGVYNQAQDIADTYYDELTKEQQGQVDLTRLTDLMNFFNEQVSTMADVVSTGLGGTFYSDGLLMITSGEWLNFESIHWEAGFKPQNINSIIIGEDVEGCIVDNGALRSCWNLTSVTVEKGAKITIGDRAFGGFSTLTSVTVEEGAEITIGDGAFESCSSLTEIRILGSVTYIGSWAFGFCSSLTKVILPEAVPAAASNLFSGTGVDKINFIIPEDSIETYLQVDTWKDNIKRINGCQVENGQLVISTVAVTLEEPLGSQPLSEVVTCDLGKVSGTVAWTKTTVPGGLEESVDAGTAAEYGTTYTAKVTLSSPSIYKFADPVTVTLKGQTVTGTVSDSGKTLTFSKTYQTKQAQDSPNISVDYQNEKLNTTADMEYSTDGGGSWKTCTADMKAAALGWDGTERTMQIRMKETADKDASASTEVTIPARPAITVSQTTGSTTASGLTVQADGVPQGAAVQYQLVADGSSIDSEKWQKSGGFTNLKADTSYTAYAKCGATTSSFASDTSSGQTVKTLAAAYTVTIPSEVIAGDSTSKGKAEISVNRSESFDLGYNGQVQVKVQSGGAVSAGGVLTLTRQDAFDTLTSDMYVDKNAFTDITNPVATFTMSNYESAKAAVSFAEPKTTDTTQTVIPAGTYSGTVFFEVSYND